MSSLGSEINRLEIIIGLGLLVGVCLLLLLWRRAPWRGARTRYPIVLAHGLMGFADIGVGPLRSEYFRGVGAHLESLGNIVIRPTVPPLASIEQRAQRLAEAIRAAPGRRVNVIAHSMGGLDARYAISKLGLRRKVASLTTIGTPHRGTRVADIGTFGVGALLKKIGLAAFLDLTSASMSSFNGSVKNGRGVRYGCVLASVRGGSGVNPLLKLTFELLGRGGAPNDGMVSEASQRWGNILMRIETDHWGQIGWSKGFDAPRFYERLARKLRARGL